MFNAHSLLIQNIINGIANNNRYPSLTKNQNFLNYQLKTLIIMDRQT